MCLIVRCLNWNLELYSSCRWKLVGKTQPNAHCHNFSRQQIIRLTVRWFNWSDFFLNCLCKWQLAVWGADTLWDKILCQWNTEPADSQTALAGGGAQHQLEVWEFWAMRLCACCTRRWQNLASRCLCLTSSTSCSSMPGWICAALSSTSKTTRTTENSPLKGMPYEEAHRPYQQEGNQINWPPNLPFQSMVLKNYV